MPTTATPFTYAVNAVEELTPGIQNLAAEVNFVGPQQQPEEESGWWAQQDRETEQDNIIFHMQRNTADAQIRALEADQPREITRRNFYYYSWDALRAEKIRLKNIIANYREKQLTNNLIPLLRNKDIQIFGNLIEKHMGWSFEDISDRRLDEERTFVNATYEEYNQSKNRYLREQREYQKPQAQYWQQKAVLRQKPRAESTIDVNDVVTTVCQWDNVWGVTAYEENSRDQERLHIVIGLSDIWMDESADDSAYTNPEPILLAPFAITLTLNSEGFFTVASASTYGLSRERPGRVDFDFHPHQLSDSPCFGSFGQTFIDLISQGEVVALISGLIAFYSQYNSQDSAGVAAKYYHPEHISRPTDYDEYKEGLLEFTAKNELIEKFSVIDALQLNEAMQGYSTYWEDNRHMSAPELENTQRCYHCEDNPVRDDYDEFYIDANANRICEPCWFDNYCTDCERHVEDCECHDDDDEY